MPENREKLSLITERYLETPEFPKIVIVQTTAPSFRSMLQELQAAQDTCVINDTPMFNAILMSSSSVDLIRGLAEREDVIKILPNITLGPRLAKSTISY